MSVSIIQTDYEALAAIANRFGDRANATQITTQRVADQVEQLRGGGWIGQDAQAFYTEMDGEVLLAMQRLIEALETTRQTILNIIQDFQRAEDEASGQVRGGGGDGSWLDRYVSGDDWQLLNNAGFADGELLTQVGGSCTIYGIMNLLVQEGIDISQLEAAGLLQQMTERYGRDNAFPLDAATSILDHYGVDYTVGNFHTASGGADRAAAEQFLINNLSNGNSVYVWTETDDTFGIANAGHAYTVMGVQTDANGTMTNVLVATNWGAPNDVMVISADAFMDDWTNYGGYGAQYVTVP